MSYFCSAFLKLSETIVMLLKQKVYEHYLQLIREKISLLQTILDDLKESGSNETKSTAGDKHETALAMLQIEQENNRRQLKEAQEQLAMFEKIDPNSSSAHITKGSLVKTDKGYLFISIALQKIKLEGLTIIGISPLSPLGKKITGLKAGEMAEINGVTYLIEHID